MNLDSLYSGLKALARDTREQVRRAMAPPARLMTRDDRAEVEDLIYQGSELTTAYGFMLFSACGIAALGLLQSSVAVVIGAMLISPLMGPIIAMGMAMARLKPVRFRRAAVTLAIGAVLSVLASTLIVWASPLKDATPEILARTRPTLLDLVVALLSGFVGAYLSINQKGAAIAGVAIATALMPPLAVVGYGLATLNWSVAGGAALLFITNVVAILGAVYAVARRYGFKPVRKEGDRYEVAALVSVIILLCVPLAFSLTSITAEARETIRARDAINTAFDGQVTHITDLRVRVRRGRAEEVSSVVITPTYKAAAATRVAQILGGDPDVVVEQIITASGVSPLEAGALGARPTAPAAPKAPSEEDRLNTMLSATGEVQAIELRDDGAFAVSILLSGEPTLADYRATEQAAARFVASAPVHILPPVQALPAVMFERGLSTPSAEGEAAIADIAWALERWGINTAEVTGRASPGRRGARPVDLRLAENRARAVADQLTALGVGAVNTRAEVPEAIEGEETDYWTAVVRASPG